MILIRGTAWAFVHIPKTGGTSIGRALRPLAETQGKEWDKMYQFHEGGGHCHAPGSEMPHTHRGFAVVRYPADRLVSFYTHYGRPPEDFWAWAKYIANCPDRRGEFYRPQVHYLERVARLLRFSDLEAEWAAFSAAELGGPIELEHTNRRKFERAPEILERWDEVDALARAAWPEDYAALEGKW